MRSAAVRAGTPCWSYSANLRYRLPTPDTGTIGSFYLGAEYYHVAQEYQGYALCQPMN